MYKLDIPDEVLEEIKAFLLANKDRIAEGIRRFEDAEKQVGEDFAKTYASIRAMMEKEGFALPKDANEFLDWYVYVKNAFVTPAEFVKNWEGLQPYDFREFAEYKKCQFYHGGKMGELPAQVAPETAPEPLTFERLFKSDSLAAWAYQLAVDVGMIYGKGRWGKKWREGAIVIYWEFLKEIPERITEQVNDNMAIDAISAHFGKSVSDRTRRGTPKYRDDLRRALKAAKKDLPV